ncbi:bifunctional 2-polyprenyl-6-hydroxyphenol methylase/3-demethylubiquinol 3-O-methyltransferase UbiG [Synechococcus sp. CS-1332]|uniref:class I SAM-dependent methyltransferase n=1 Tax=Synechococcus sp. CS-1332 TaxID=2847972 RepID=UPI00223B497E|nr:class I SAM-dependent methyltransferase [Synechococcus sp. CS-1332]MCT0206232.1 class I SAM-dependent methyltransferase [Synechococcus sp. CS-1332]
MITYLSEAVPVDMADKWYEFSRPDHFWIARRFKVMHTLIRSWLSGTPSWLDVGCGSGLLQSYCRDRYHLDVIGADLNIVALKLNPSGVKSTYCYDINSRQVQLEQTFDIVSAMDVIEHIDDEHHFVESLLFHVRPGGQLLINVPALQCCFSKYDVEAGHKRRYSANDVKRIAKEHNLSIIKWSYWGLALIPVLIMRNFIVHFSERSKVIQRGFSPSSPFVGRVLGFLASLEILPNHFAGTSLMIVFKKQ